MKKEAERILDQIEEMSENNETRRIGLNFWNFDSIRKHLGYDRKTKSILYNGVNVYLIER